MCYQKFLPVHLSLSEFVNAYSSLMMRISKNEIYCVFESSLLHILLADNIISTSKQFQEMKDLRLLKAVVDMKTITRAKYLDRIIELNGTPDIKIITGIRRSGKSKLMQAYIEYLKSHFENINIIFIDFMDLAYEEIWITAEYMKTSFALSFFAVDTMSMLASSIKRRSTLLLREAARRFIFRSATTFPGRKHLRENALLCFRSEMLIRK